MSQQAPPSASAPDQGLLANPRFVSYSYAKFLSLLGQNALVYGLFVAVITRDHSSLATSAFVLASIVPSIVLSLPGGIFADALPKKLALLSAMLARIVIVVLFLRADPGIEVVILLTTLLWAAYQFFSPAESAALLAVIPGSRLGQASSILHAVSLAAQLAGAGLVAPLAVKLIGVRGLYASVLVLFAISGFLYASIPNLSPPRSDGAARPASYWKALPTGFRTIAADPRLSSITLMRVLLDAASLVLVVSAPVFIEDILHIRAENLIYVALPGALGLALGLLIAPPLLNFVSARGLVLAGFVLFTSTLLLLPFVDKLGRDLAGATGPIHSLTSSVNLSDALVSTMLLLPLLGLGTAFVQVAARTEVYRRVPAGILAQVFATQSALGSVVALFPTFLAGVCLDLLPVRVVLVATGLALAALSLAAWLRGLRVPPPRGVVG